MGGKGTAGRTLPIREKTGENTASSPSLSQGERRKPTGNRRHLPWVLRESQKAPTALISDKSTPLPLFLAQHGLRVDFQKAV